MVGRGRGGNRAAAAWREGPHRFGRRGPVSTGMITLMEVITRRCCARCVALMGRGRGPEPAPDVLTLTPRSALTVGANGVRHDKQPMLVLRQPVPQVPRQPAPRGRPRPGLHWECIFRRNFGKSSDHNGLPPSRCRRTRMRAKSQRMQPTVRSGASN